MRDEKCQFEICTFHFSFRAFENPPNSYLSQEGYRFQRVLESPRRYRRLRFCHSSPAYYSSYRHRSTHMSNLDNRKQYTCNCRNLRQCNRKPHTGNLARNSTLLVLLIQYCLA